MNKMKPNSRRCSRQIIFVVITVAVLVSLLQYQGLLQLKITSTLMFTSSDHLLFNETLMSQIQEQRHKQLQNFCKNQQKERMFGKTNGLQKLLRQRDKESLRTLKQLIYNDRAKLIFCSVPKVASTNWKRILHTLQGRFQNPTDNDGHLIHQGLPDITELSKSQLQGRLEHYFSFLFTRHPFERVVSAYRDKLYSSKDKYLQHKYNRIIYRLYRNESYTPDKAPVTFTEFVKYIIGEWKNERSHRLNLHWRPVTLFCLPCLLNYTFIGKLETIEQDSYHITNYINKETNMNLALPTLRRYKTESRTSLSDYYDEISDEVLRDLYNVYENDFSAFGYSLNGIFSRLKTW